MMLAELPDLPALAELKSRRQWVAWKYEYRNGTDEKPTKPPISPRTGFKASHSDPGTWGTYDEAVLRVHRSRLAGVGYVLSDDDDLTGVDLDNCRDPETGELAPWAREIVALSETYTEISPSGTGLRIIWRGKIDRTVKCDPASVEIYRSKRYLTVTGNHVPGTPEAILPAPGTQAALLTRADEFKPVAPDPAHSVYTLPAQDAAGAAADSPGGDGRSFFREANSAALANLEAWVPVLFPRARHQPGTGAWRVSSRDLGRPLQEDLSISPSGIKDWGVHDIGDPRLGSRTPIDLVMAVEGLATAKEAGFWLCRRMGRAPADFGWSDDEAQAAFGAELASQLLSKEKVDEREAVASAAGIEATPFVWHDPSSIPQRQWIYGGHYIRRFLSLTLAPGGVGKSSLIMAEALAMATFEDYLGHQPAHETRVWLWNGEDPIDEMQRRMTAAILHFDADREMVQRNLFMNSGRNTEIIIALETRKEGMKIAVPVVDAVKAAIISNQIDVLIIDPFVSSHRVTENDNNAIDQVAKTWSRIADETDCAIELVHHVRKTTGREITVEDGRGASALLAASRSARVLNSMTEEEAQSAGIKNRRGFFRMDNGKSNLAPPPDHSFWFQLVGVPLRNGPLGTDGDNVAVVAPWRWPDPMKELQADALTRVQAAIRGKLNCRADPRSEHWVGNVIAEVLDIDIAQPPQREKVKGMIKMWIKNGALKIAIRDDEKRRPRDFVEVGN